MLKFRILLFLVGGGFFLATFEAIRRRKLHEKYALLWFVSALVLLVLSAFPDMLVWISEALGVFYLTTILLICFFFLMVIMFSYAISISKLVDRNKHLSQELAILRSRIERSRQSADKPERSDK